MGENAETAILAGGCFWGVQELMRKQRGVIATRAGWTGGDIPNPTEANPGTHAEAVEIVFDPEQTSFRDILEFFFQIHDPTTINRQMDYIGTDYRSAIFYASDEQKRVAEDTIADVDASGLWPGKVVTEIKPAGQPAQGSIGPVLTGPMLHWAGQERRKPTQDRRAKRYRTWH